MYRARPLFDLRPIHGPRRFWEQIEATVAGAVDSDLLRVLANDCLATLPPLTFFQDAVIERIGRAVLDVSTRAQRAQTTRGRRARVWRRGGDRARSLDAGAVRLAAGPCAPEHESIFRDASETLRIVLWQQGRVGISQGTGGLELPPAVLSRSDRHRLKSGFRSILRLIEFTGRMTGSKRCERAAVSRAVSQVLRDDVAG